jgi:hypothetical protein
VTDIEIEVAARISLDYLYEKAKGICYVCNKPVARAVASREHILPESLGGTNDPSNLTLSHKKCNNKRGNGYKSIHSRYHRFDTKHFALLEEYGLLIQVVPQGEGAYIILSKKKENDDD